MKSYLKYDISILKYIAILMEKLDLLCFGLNRIDPKNQFEVQKLEKYGCLLMRKSHCEKACI